MKLPPQRRLIGAGVTVALFGFAVFALRRTLATTSMADIEAAAVAISSRDLALAGLLTVSSYAALTLYDLLALRLIDAHVPVLRVMRSAFVAYAFANTLGVPSLSGGSVRLRGYMRDGLGALQVASVQALCSLTFMLGALWITGFAMLLDASSAALALRLSEAGVRTLGATLLGLVVAYAVLSKLRRRLRMGRWTLSLPTLRYAVTQLLVSSLDLCLAASCLYVLLPAAPTLSFAPFLAVFVLALAAGVISSVPGGLGVFETTLVLLMPTAEAHKLLGAVLVYRAIYYLSPFLVALALFVMHELRPTRPAP